MIGSNLRIVLIAAVICYFLIILKFLKDKALSLKYTLLWIFAGIVMGMLVVFPSILIEIIGLLGIQSSMNGLFIFCIAFLMMILMSITSIVSRQNRKIRTLIQEIGILEKRIRELEIEKTQAPVDEISKPKFR